MSDARKLVFAAAGVLVGAVATAALSTISDRGTEKSCRQESRQQDSDEAVKDAIVAIEKNDVDRLRFGLVSLPLTGCADTEIRKGNVVWQITGCTPLIAASFFGNTEAIGVLLARGTRVNQPSVRGVTPLFIMLRTLGISRLSKC